MTFADLTADIRASAPGLRGRLEANAPLAPFTWFRVGGPAQCLFTPADEADLAHFLTHLAPEIPVTVIGAASNMIVRDGGAPGVVIRLSPKGFGEASATGDLIVAGAACPDKMLANAAAAAGLAGLEFFYGIPGTVGGALRMNAGTRSNTNPEIEGETRDRFVSARAAARDGSIVTLSPQDMKFEYRRSGAPGDLIFTQATFRGVPDDEAAIRARMAQVQAHRERDQETRAKTGGSTFKNPPGHSAWRLIDAAGCRGLRHGGAQVSEKHCNFLLNLGEATAADIEALGEEVRDRVRAQSGVTLEWEIKRIGVAR
ncbi:MAG: UDP-N-acetylmuramate dehydrogenase [Methylobacteriaceae bacterium]|nr:UDP-N-acetylmuramate dehydrogenase [Methylobacteriaceae bacterium]